MGRVSITLPGSVNESWTLIVPLVPLNAQRPRDGGCLSRGQPCWAYSPFMGSGHPVSMTGVEVHDMSRTEKFREQHRDLVAMVGQLAPHLTPARLAKESAEVRSLLSQFAAKLNVHLAMEDKALYPQLLQHKDPAVQGKAKTFMDQMGGIKEAFSGYMAKYPTAHAIEASPAGFISDTEGLIKVLAARIQAEDSDLYALVDRLE